MMKFLQKLGRSLMLPVAVLPAAAILMGIGYIVDPNVMTGLGTPNGLSVLLVKAGEAIIGNLPWLFAIGIAIGMSKNKDGAAALAALVAMFIVKTLLDPATISAITGTPLEQVSPAYGKVINAFTGIISGLVAAGVYNRFHQVKLPNFLAFFSGKRAVPIITSFVMLVVTGLLYFIWPPVYTLLVELGKSVISLGPIGAGIYGFFNRLLIPTGLHHALNSVFWFDVAGIADITTFWKGINPVTGQPGVLGVTGMYQAGFFPVMMFGLPGAALAMLHTAKSNKKKVAMGILVAAAFASFFTGVTEPIEFAFMFLAPALYVTHAVLTGIFLTVAAILKTTAGFSFSAGLIDYVLSSQLPMANKPLILLVLGAIAFVVYYALFRFIIVKFDLKTPGREDDDYSDEDKDVVLANDNFTEIAKIVFEGLGGKANVVDIDYCSTRLRVELKDSSIVDDAKIKSAGVAGLIKPSSTTAQVIVGTQVQFVFDEIVKLNK